MNKGGRWFRNRRERWLRNRKERDGSEIRGREMVQK